MMTRSSSVGFFALCLLFTCLPAVHGYVAQWRRQATEDFRLTHITKQSIPGGFLIQLHMEGNQIPRIGLIRSFAETQETLQVGPDGVAQFNVNTESRVLLFFIHPHEFRSMNLNVGESTPSVQYVPDMRLVVAGGPEVRFPEGTDVDLNIDFTVISENSMSWSPSIYVHMDVKSKSSKPEITTHYPSEKSNVLQIVTEGQSNDLTSAHVRVKTASGDVEGVLHVEAYGSIHCEQNCMLDYVYIAKDIPIYREGQDGPFPQHFIGYLRRHPEDDNVFCSLRLLCFIYCELVGDQPSSLEILRLHPSGETTATSYVSFAYGGYRSVGHYSIINGSTDDSGDYVCKSRSGTVEFTHTIHLTVGLDAKVKTFTKGPASEDGAVEATCQAEGLPRPSIVIMDNNGVPVTQGVTRVNETTSKAVVRIADPTTLEYLICEAHNEINGLYFTVSRRLDLNLEHSDMPSQVRYYLENFVVEE